MMSTPALRNHPHAPARAIAASALGLIVAGQLSLGGGNGGTDCNSSTGADVIVGDLPNVANYSSEGAMEAFAVGTTSCNIGDQELLWYSSTNEHPVIGQNMFRLKDGRFEQVGQSWLKHGFTALQQDACGCGCQPSGTGSLLGIGCSDPYSASLNGSQGGLGPKFEIDAHTGAFPYPYTDPPYSGSVARRLQVSIADLDPAQDGGGTYFIEGHYIAPDDAQAGNGDNNASYRECTISGGGSSWSVGLSGMPATQREQPGIRAWQDYDPSVVETDVRIPNEGLVILAAKATDLGNGWYAYEYAIQNLNSDRSIGSVSIPTGGALQNIGFHDVDYHSGEPWDGTDWVGVPSGGSITWATDAYSSNPNANAIRWGTLYNFRFESTAAPAASTMTLGIFKPGGSSTVDASTIGPQPGPADCNNNGVDDDLDISGGTSNDCDANGIPDECQPDCDSDGIPDVCELDTDGDGVVDDCDNCINDFNPLQEDADLDGVGNACDPDYQFGVLFEDDFETDEGWIVENLGATSGDWQRGVPVNDGAWDYDPASDSDGSGQCFLTQNELGNTDVDNGAVRLTSPQIDMSGGGVTISYDYFLRMTNQGGTDFLRVEISSNGLGGPWTELVAHANDNGLAWVPYTIEQTDLDNAGVTLTSTMRLRFTANDADPQSIVEAGVDAVYITGGGSIVDCNGNGIDDAVDISSGGSDDCNENGVPDECELGGIATNYDLPVSPPLDIPDGTGVFVSDSFTVPDSGTIVDLDLGVTVNHTYNGDLIVRVSHNGTTVTVIDRPGYTGSGFGFGDDGLDIVLDDEGTGGDIESATTGGPALLSPPSYVPNNPLSAFDGMDKSGVWTIEVSDNASQDFGSLDNWELIITNAGSKVEPCDPTDCNKNGIEDTLDIRQGTSLDCNLNNIPDECDIAAGTSLDCDLNGVPDECQVDCNNNGEADACDILFGASEDCNGNGVPDECDLVDGTSFDCNNNGVLDECDIANGTSDDCDGGPVGILADGATLWGDLCFACHGVDGSGGIGPDLRNYSRVQIWDELWPVDGDHPGGQRPEFTQQMYANLEAFLDLTGSSRGRPDLIPDECQTVADCDGDSVSDACELEIGTQIDVDFDGIPDECQVPNGACCFSDGSCTIETESDCTLAGGTYLGDGVSCVDSDGDGTFDCADGCPNDPDKTEPGDCGCGTPDTDSDGDGVPDCLDDCPNDPDKVVPGACGCGTADTDSDGDGVPDCNDGCPNDPDKTEPGDCGCGTPDTDSDGDGVPDCNDGCPNDPDKIAPGECGCGTPDTDSDGDGVPDCFDGCPNDPDKTEPGECGCGEPDFDGDGDGVPDCIDGCPTDPDKTEPGDCGCGEPDTDSDGDGVPDCFDECPSDPNKTEPGECGCGVDEDDFDGDGVPDCNDGCPFDPDKTEPGECGCGTPDIDSDGDGVFDCNDGCPNDPDKTEPGECGCGTPDDDSDGDGVPDCEDGCPNDPDKTEPGDCGCGVSDEDSDGDGFLDCDDNCVNTFNPGQEDCDGDGVGDACAGEPDCNSNGIPDSCDIADGTSQDENGNSVPDECEKAPCPGDIDGSGEVEFNDLVLLLSAWGPCSGCPADIDGSGEVEFNDLVLLLSLWGPCE